MQIWTWEYKVNKVFVFFFFLIFELDTNKNSKKILNLIFNVLNGFNKPILFENKYKWLIEIITTLKKKNENTW